MRPDSTRPHPDRQSRHSERSVKESAVDIEGKGDGEKVLAMRRTLLVRPPSRASQRTPKDLMLIGRGKKKTAYSE